MEWLDAKDSLFPQFTWRTNNIRGIAEQCRHLLEACSSLPVLKEDEWAENRLAEFRLWTANAGVFARDRASLDSRLTLQPEARGIIISLLTILAEALLVLCQSHSSAHPVPSTTITAASKKNDSQSSLLLSTGRRGSSTTEADEPKSEEALLTADHPDPVPRSFSPWSDDSDTDSDEDEDEDSGEDSRVTTESSLETSKTEVSEVIDHLSRLTFAIRKAGSTSRSHKADRAFKPDEHEALRRHLNIVVLARGTADGRIGFDLDSKRLTAIQSRLIAANLRRRNRFLYAQRHARKLADEIPEESLAGETLPSPPEQPREPGKSGELQPQEIPLEQAQGSGGATVEPIVQQTMEAPPSILSGTSASALTHVLDLGIARPSTPSRVAKTEITATTAKMSYPKPPSLAKGVRHFRCPCCCQVLPEMYRQASLWKKHLMSDICPYTCIIEDCPTPNLLFVSRNEWRRHVDKDHRQCWQCLPCTTAGNAPLLFPSIQAFVEHMRDAHAGTIKEDQYSTLIPEAARPVPTGISCCPLCDSNGPADSAPLLDHIAEHLHSFALRSLPWPCRDKPETDVDDQDDPTSDDGEASYFQDHDYFDMMSEVESRQFNPTDSSDRDSDGLPSLHSDDGSSNFAKQSVDEGMQDSDAFSAVMEPPPQPSERIFLDPKAYDPTNLPIELRSAKELLPEVIRGPVIVTGGWRYDSLAPLPLDPQVIENLAKLLYSTYSMDELSIPDDHSVPEAAPKPSRLENIRRLWRKAKP